MIEDDDPGPTRTVRLLKPRSPEPKEAPPAESSAQATRVRSARKACVDASGERFGPYVLLGEVGKGGMAEVRLAVEMLEVGGIRACVVKRAVEGEARDDILDGLRDEARILRDLRHPSIIELYRASEIDGRFHLAFELVDGVSLRQLLTMIAPSPVPARIAIDIGIQTARALTYVHGARDETGAPLLAVHRDLTPQNVLVARGGFVKLVDFGIALSAHRSARTRSGHVKGKVGYLAPEQLAPKSGTDPRLDVFTLGLVLAELVTARRVLPRKVLVVQDLEALLRARCKEAPQPIPGGLVDLLVAMTAADVEARPSAQETASALGKILREAAPSTSLADFVDDRALRKLLPLDLESIFELPTRRATPLDSAELEGSSDDAYSATIRLLTGARMSSAINL